MILSLFKKSAYFFSLFLVFTIISCSNDGGNNEGELMEESDNNEEPPNPDKGVYIALRNDGQLFEIGDESGIVKQMGRVSGIVFNTLFNSVTGNGTTSFIYEQDFDPFQAKFYTFDVASQNSRPYILDFPSEIPEDFPGLIALDWDNQNQDLVGLVRDVVNESDELINYVVRMDPDTFEMSYTGISFVQPSIRSTTLKDGSLYMSSANHNNIEAFTYSKMDLTNGTLEELPLPDSGFAPYSLSNTSGDNKLFGFVLRPDPSKFLVDPVLIDPIQESIEIIVNDKEFALRNVYGKSYYNNATNENVTIVGLYDEPEDGLLRFDANSKTFKIVLLTGSDNLSSLIRIIGYSPN